MLILAVISAAHAEQQKTDWSPRRTSAHETIWQRTLTVINPATGGLEERTQSFIELATGLNVPLADGSFVAADPAFSLTETGAAALGARHQVRVLGDIASPGAVEITTPGGIVLRGNPIGIGYYSPYTGESVLLASLTNSVGWLLASNEIIFSNCFSGLRASILLKNRVAGFSQSLVLHESPNPPEVYGLSPDSRLELFTEWDPATPAPSQETHILFAERNPAMRQQMVSPDLVDAELTFGNVPGAMRMGRGTAFAADGGLSLGNRVPVAKSFVSTEDGRQILVEAASYQRLRQFLTNLPPALPPGRTNASIAPRRSFPHGRLAGNAQPARLHRASASKPGGRTQYALIADYEIDLLDPLVDYTFRGDSTYRLADLVYLSGQIVVEGSVVFKADASGGLYQTAGSFTTRTTPYRPIIFSVTDDDTVGVTIPGSSGSPGRSTQWALSFDNGVTVGSLQHFRFLYQGGCFFSWDMPLDIRHLQTVQCNGALTTFAPAYIGNALMVQTPFALDVSATTRVENATFDQVGEINDTSADLFITNSLLIAVTNIDSFTGGFNGTNSSPGSVFEAMGGGSAYLQAGSGYRGIGSTNIDPALLADFTACTTYAPTLLTNRIAAATNLVAVTPRGGAQVDLGAYYPAVDYVANNVVVTNCTLTIYPQVVVASIGTNGFVLTDKAVLSAEGEPFRRVLFADYRNVQEQATNWGARPSDALMFNSNYRTNGAGPVARFRFADLVTVSDQGPFLASDADGCRYDAISLRDSSVAAGRLFFGGNRTNVVGITNNIFDRARIQVTNQVIFHSFNNLFYNSTLNWTNQGTNVWFVQDNAFDSAAVTNSGTVRQTNNGYINANGRITPTNGTEIILASFIYTNGPLGGFYHHSTDFTDAGSRYASNAFLFHHTTRADQSKEAATKVDAGFHYVALSQNGEYLDFDDDGLPDWFEDNGNGLAETNSPLHETNWQSPDTDGDGIEDMQYVVEWDMRSPTGTNYNGILIEGNGFQVDANRQNIPPLLKVYFDPRYRNTRIRDFPRSTGLPIRAIATNIDFVDTHYILRYDLRSATLSRGGVLMTLLDFGAREWLDNMTEAVGTNGPANLNTPVNSTVIVSAATAKKNPFNRHVPYTWEGWIGNTSEKQFGRESHGAYEPVKKLVIHTNGTEAFYTCGYNENQYELQKFNPQNPQLVISNFGRLITINEGSSIITNLAISNNVLYAKRADGVINKYSVSTCQALGADTVFPAPAMPALSPTVTKPLDWSRSPIDGAIAVFDASNEVVHVYNSNGVGIIYTIGVANGYSNGPAILIPDTNGTFRTQVKLGSEWFNTFKRATNATVGYQPDGKLWVSDTTTGRLLRFTTNGGCDSWMMYVPHTYCTSADPNDPARVFNQYLEFRVDYAKALPTGWILTNYWGYGAVIGDSEENGLFTVTGVTLGGSTRTYAMVYDPKSSTQGCNQGVRIAELTSTGLRLTSVSNLFCSYELEPDGALQRILDLGNGSIQFQRQRLTNFTAGGDPMFDAPQVITTASYNPTNDPAQFHFKQIGTNLVVQHPFDEHKGYHVGAVSSVDGHWLWRKSPVGPFNGRGNFETNCEHSNGQFAVIDEDVFFIHRAEFWKGRQGNQIFHYKADGTFVGQFGMPAYNDVMPHAIGSASNMKTLSVIKTNGVIYLHTNDEYGRGMQRWRLDM